MGSGRDKRKKAKGHVAGKGAAKTERRTEKNEEKKERRVEKNAKVCKLMGLQCIELRSPAENSRGSGMISLSR